MDFLYIISYFQAGGMATTGKTVVFIFTFFLIYSLTNKQKFKSHSYGSHNSFNSLFLKSSIFSMVTSAFRLFTWILDISFILTVYLSIKCTFNDDYLFKNDQ